jgi:hypothetical protein
MVVCEGAALDLSGAVGAEVELVGGQICDDGRMCSYTVFFRAKSGAHATRTARKYAQRYGRSAQGTGAEGTCGGEVSFRYHWFWRTPVFSAITAGTACLLGKSMVAVSYENHAAIAQTLRNAAAANESW